MMFILALEIMKFTLSLICILITLYFEENESSSIIRPSRIKPPASVYNPIPLDYSAPQQNYKVDSIHQYANVEAPGVFEWGYRKGVPKQHTRGQMFKQKGSTFKSVVRTSKRAIVHSVPSEVERRSICTPFQDSILRIVLN